MTVGLLLGWMAGGWTSRLCLLMPYSEEESLVSLTALAIHKHKGQKNPFLTFLPPLMVSPYQPLTWSRKHILFSLFYLPLLFFQSISKHCWFNIINFSWFLSLPLYTHHRCRSGGPLPASHLFCCSPVSLTLAFAPQQTPTLPSAGTF